MLRDFEYGFRRLLKQPGFTLIAVLALALGIGANTATFSLLNSVVLKPLPYKDADRLVKIWATSPEQAIEQTEISYTKFRAIRDQNRSFDSVTVYHDEDFNLTDRENPEAVHGTRISKEFFDVWGVEPLNGGRRFTPQEDERGGPDVVLLSEGFWERRFGRDPKIVGKIIQLEARPFEVIGVMPKVLRFPFNTTDIWLPRAQELSFFSEQQIEGGSGFLFGAAKLKPGVTAEKAGEDINRISKAYAEQFPANIDSTFKLKTVRMNEELVGPVRSGLFLLLGAVGLVLLIACADVASLLLAQGLSRRHEIAIRVAMGATRGRILRQMLAEGILLALLGSLVGLLLAYWGLDLLVANNPGNLPRIDQVRIDGTVLGFTLLLSVITGVLFSVVPALQTTKTDAKSHLRENDRGSTGSGTRTRLQGVFVTAEVALALVLLIAAGLLIQSFRKLSSVDTGFNPKGLIVALVTLPTTKYPGAEERRVFFERATEEIRNIPGVDSAAGIDFIPVLLTARTVVLVEGRPAPPMDQMPVAWRSMPQPGFFGTLGARIIRGTDFDPKIAPDSPLTGIINESFVKQYFPGEDPVGKYVLVGRSQQRVQIVGVVNDLKRGGLDLPASPEFYLSARQARASVSPATFMYIAIRSKLPAESIAGSVRNVIRSLDREQPVTDIQTFEDIITDSIASRRLTMSLLTGFSAAALALCILGIYGVVAHSVSMRKKEIGVRMALGAQPSHVLSTVTRQGLKSVLLGVAIGLAAAFALSRILEKMLFEVSVHDPLYFAASPILLVIVAALACYLPARRATRIEPSITLRTD
jgi:predicted permease